MFIPNKRLISWKFRSFWIVKWSLIGRQIEVKEMKFMLGHAHVVYVSMSFMNILSVKIFVYRFLLLLIFFSCYVNCTTVNIFIISIIMFSIWYCRLSISDSCLNLLRSVVLQSSGILGTYCLGVVFILERAVTKIKNLVLVLLFWVRQQFIL